MNWHRSARAASRHDDDDAVGRVGAAAAAARGQVDESCAAPQIVLEPRQLSRARAQSSVLGAPATGGRLEARSRAATAVS